MTRCRGCRSRRDSLDSSRIHSRTVRECPYTLSPTLGFFRRLILRELDPIDEDQRRRGERLSSKLLSGSGRLKLVLRFICFERDLGRVKGKEGRKPSRFPSQSPSNPSQALLCSQIRSQSISDSEVLDPGRIGRAEATLVDIREDS